MSTYPPETRLVTFDLDSTLCNTGHRQHLIDRENGTDWVAYSMACADDAPVHGLVTVARLLALVPNIVVHGLSARKHAALDLTMDWMRQQGVPLEKVWLDESTVGDYIEGYTHADYKLARLRAVEEATGLTVILHFDDYSDVAYRFEQAGVPTVCVRTPQEIEESAAAGFSDLWSVK